jgi:hypothetical protein
MTYDREQLRTMAQTVLADLAAGGQRGMQLVLRIDAEALRQDLQLLAQAAERSIEVRERLLELGDLAAQFGCVHTDDGAAAAGELRIRLEPTDGLRALLTAVRTGDVDGLPV